MIDAFDVNADPKTVAQVRAGDIPKNKANDLGMTCVATTTTDPDGLECNFFGWLNGMRRLRRSAYAP